MSARAGQEAFPGAKIDEPNATWRQNTTARLQKRTPEGACSPLDEAAPDREKIDMGPSTLWSLLALGAPLSPDPASSTAAPTKDPPSALAPEQASPSGPLDPARPSPPATSPANLSNPAPEAQKTADSEIPRSLQASYTTRSAKPSSSPRPSLRPPRPRSSAKGSKDHRAARNATAPRAPKPPLSRSPSSGATGLQTRSKATQASNHALGETAPTFGGSVGLLRTPIADAGGTHTFRFALQQDLFQKEGLFCCNGESSLRDRHRRYRSSVSIGYSPTFWAELSLSLHSSVNRNERSQPQRQDPTSVFALGDTSMALKLVAPWWRGPWRVALLQNLAFLSGSKTKFSPTLVYAVQALGTWDFRRNRRRLPLRASLGLGPVFDASHRMYDWSHFEDPLSREVFRFGVDSQQNRLRTQVAVDVPLSLKAGRRSLSLDPMLEIQWERAFRALPDFQPKSPKQGTKTRQKTGASGMDPSGGQQSSVAMTVGLRTIWAQTLAVGLGYEVALMQPDVAFAPRIAPWQLLLSISGSFSLRGQPSHQSSR